jgi:hypothetical protein
MSLSTNPGLDPFGTRPLPPIPAPRPARPVTAAPMPGPVADLRASLTAHVAQRLGGLREGFRHNIALVGPQGNGKSHLAEHAIRSLDPSILRIVCPLQPLAPHGLARQLAAAVLRSVVDDPDAASLEALCDRAARLAPQTVQSVIQLDRSATGHWQGESLVQALDLIPVLHRELDRPCVLVLDEFLHLADIGGAHLFHELGKRVVTWPFAVFLLTSSWPTRARQILRERLHLLFGQFELISLGPVEARPTLAWMEQELSATADGHDLLTVLLQWTGQSVWALRLLVRRMRELGVLMGSPARVDVLAVRALWDVLGSSEGALHQWYVARMQRLDGVRYGALAREALMALADGAKTAAAVGQRCQTHRHVPQALQLLLEQDLVARRGACWVIPDPMLRLWLTEVQDPIHAWRVAETLRTAERFERAARTMLGAWLRSARCSLIDRVTSLFGYFCNETIALQHKTGRLPTFRDYRAVAVGPLVWQLIADAPGQRWCSLVADVLIDEAAISGFERFCQQQHPRPSRKVVIAPEGLDPNAKLQAKESGMWVWELEDLRLLCLLYGQPAPEGA